MQNPKDKQPICECDKRKFSEEIAEWIRMTREQWFIESDKSWGRIPQFIVAFSGSFTFCIGLYFFSTSTGLTQFNLEIVFTSNLLVYIFVVSVVISIFFGSILAWEPKKNRSYSPLSIGSNLTGCYFDDRITSLSIGRIVVNFYMKIYCSKFLILGLLFATAGLFSPAKSQDVQLELNLNEFEDKVLIPENFGFDEKIEWGAKALFNHKAIKAIVPVFAYVLNEVCHDFSSSTPQSNSWPELTALFLSPSNSNPSETITWTNSLEEGCNPKNGKPDQFWVDNAFQTWGKDTIANNVAQNLIQTVTLDAANNESMTSFVLTAGKLPNVHIKPTSEYWWICRDDQSPQLYSACHATFSMSPYNQHRNLVQQ